MLCTCHVKCIQSPQTRLACANPMHGTLVMGSINRASYKAALADVIIERTFDPIGIRILQLACAYPSSQGAGNFYLG